MAVITTLIMKWSQNNEISFFFVSNNRWWEYRAQERKRKYSEVNKFLYEKKIITNSSSYMQYVFMNLNISFNRIS